MRPSLSIAFGSLLVLSFTSPTLGLAGTDALGVTGPDAPSPAFLQLDADGDGLLDRTEFETMFVADDPEVDAFGFFDLDHDGFIAPGEFDVMGFEEAAPETDA